MGIYKWESWSKYRTLLKILGWTKLQENEVTKAEENTVFSDSPRGRAGDGGKEWLEQAVMCELQLGRVLWQMKGMPQFSPSKSGGHCLYQSFCPLECSGTVNKPRFENHVPTLQPSPLWCGWDPWQRQQWRGAPLNGKRVTWASDTALLNSNLCHSWDMKYCVNDLVLLILFCSLS